MEHLSPDTIEIPTIAPHIEAEREGLFVKINIETEFVHRSDALPKRILSVASAVGRVARLPAAFQLAWGVLPKYLTKFWCEDKEGDFGNFTAQGHRPHRSCATVLIQNATAQPARLNLTLLCIVKTLAKLLSFKEVVRECRLHLLT